MTIGMYQASVPGFQRTLKALDAILDKAVGQCDRAQDRSWRC